MARLRRILAPTDFSDCSIRALEYAAELAKQYGAEIILLHVEEPITQAALSPDLIDAVRTEQHRFAQKGIEQAAERLRATGVRVRTRLNSGLAHEQIVKIAEEHRADLIVMGTHGRSGLPHLFVGSVAETVVRTASCPVLTVKSRD
jgi:nucleotide-binding universal stress UspA family protein